MIERGHDVDIYPSRPGPPGKQHEIVGRFANARPIGIARDNGPMELNPSPESAMTVGDRLILLAHDLENLETTPASTRLDSGGAAERQAARVADLVEEHILVVGWNPLGEHLLGGWAAGTSATSTVSIAFDPRLIDAADIGIADIGIDVHLATTPETSALDLERRPTTIVVLGYASLDTAEADARTMLDVLQLRRRYAEAGEVPRLVVQMLDEEHADLAELTGADDFLMGVALGSQFIAQFIDEPERRTILLELYGPGDASVRLIRCDRLDLVGTFTTADIVARSYAAGALAIGWRLVSEGGDVVLNPSADQRITLSADDEIVVVG